MSISYYQSLKLILVDIFSIPKEGFHLLLGPVVFLAAAYLLKVKISSYKALIAPFALGVFLEILDTRDAIVYGYELNIVNSLLDIALTMSLPTAAVLYMKRTTKR